MDLLGKELSDRGIPTEKWTDITGAATVFTRICTAIHANDVLLAEVTDLNPNVLFEVGYALGIGRDAVLLIDKNRTTQGGLSLLQTKYQCKYESRDQILVFVSQYLNERGYDTLPNRIVPILEGIDQTDVEDGNVYFIPAWRNDISRGIQRLLDRLRASRMIGDFRVSDPADSLFDTFSPQARLIVRSEMVIGAFVNQNYQDSVQRNAPVALLMGLAAGLGKEVLILQEQPARAVIDVGTVLHQFAGENQAIAIANEWLSSRTVALTSTEIESPHEKATSMAHEDPSNSIRTGRRERRAKRAKLRFFGPPDATLDHDLMEYFIDTPDFESAREGYRDVLIGRKGVGKSAIFTALTVDLTARQDVLPVMITPIELEYEQLSLILDRIGVFVHPNFLYPSFWKFIILTEIVRAIRDDHAIQIDTRIPRREMAVIQQAVDEFQQPLSSDFSTYS